MEHKPKILIIDGQGGRLGGLLMAELRRVCPEAELFAVGTNSIATSAMLKAGADGGATGEFPVVLHAPRADAIVGPVGIVAAGSLMGEVTPAMAQAVALAECGKYLIPSERCALHVVGAASLPLPTLAAKAAEAIRAALGEPSSDGKGSCV